MVALALELSIRSRPTRGGGGGPPALGTNGLLLTAFNDTLKVADTTTPANAYEGSTGAKIVTTRASVAWYTTGPNTVASVAINTLRLDNDLRAGAPGYLVEDSRINIVKWSDDFTNVLWVKTNITPAKDQTGPDGAANSASSIVATAAAATVTQATTTGSSTRYQSAFVKRIAGTGVVEMTMDAITWTPITVTSAWTRATIPTQTMANPTVGFRIATSGDAIAVWCAQNETSTFATSPIPTTSANVTRASDFPKLAGTLFPLNQTEGTLYAKAIMMGENAAGSQILVALDDGTTANRISPQRNSVSKKGELHMYDANAPQATQAGAVIIPALVPFKMAVGYKVNDTALAISGEAMPPTDTACTVPLTTGAVFGNRSVSAALNGWVLEAMYLPTRVSDTQLQALVS